MFTQQHHIKIAAVLKEEFDYAVSNRDSAGLYAVRRTARAMADMFKDDNSNFSYELFYAAIGM